MKRINIVTHLSIALLLLFFQVGQVLAQDDSPLDFQVVREIKLPNPPKSVSHTLDGKLVFFLTTDNNVLIYDQQGKLKGTIPVEEGVSDIDTTPRGEALFLVNQKTRSYKTLTINFVQKIDTTGSPYLGPENAPVTLVIFTDFECPYCKKVLPLIEQVVEQYPDKLKVVLKNFPLTNIHKFAEKAALAALAAAQQGKFWPFHDELFASPKINDQVIDQIATNLGLDKEKFNKDMNSREILNQLNKDVQDGNKANVSGTPSLFINGRQVKQRSLATLKKMIDEEIEKSKSGK